MTYVQCMLSPSLTSYRGPLLGIMAKKLVSMTIERQKITAKSRQTFYAGNTGQVASTGATRILFMRGTCGLIVHTCKCNCRTGHLLGENSDTFYSRSLFFRDRCFERAVDASELSNSPHSPPTSLPLPLEVYADTEML